MDGTDRANIYKKAESMGLDAFVSQYKGTKITPEMINIAATMSYVVGDPYYCITFWPDILALRIRCPPRGYPNTPDTVFVQLYSKSR